MKSRVELIPGYFPRLKAVINFDAELAVVYAPLTAQVEDVRQAIQSTRGALEQYKKAHDSGQGTHEPKSRLQEN